jgi:Skp family chaperone for outer membrane proteins
MKKIGLLVVAVSLSLSLAAFAGGTSDDSQSGQTSGAKGKARVRGQARIDPATQQKMLTEQLTSLQKEHQAAIGELQGIKALADKEKATETAAALGKLIAKHEQEHQKKIEPLQQQLKKVEAAQKDAAGKTPKKAGKAKTGN